MFLKKTGEQKLIMLLTCNNLYNYVTVGSILFIFSPQFQNDIGAFLVPYEAELQTKEHVVIYDSNTFSLKDKSEFFDLIAFV